MLNPSGMHCSFLLFLPKKTTICQGNYLCSYYFINHETKMYL